nr:MAG: hypothetical protein DIU78_25335 [Pseudomonadota bacterium]
MAGIDQVIGAMVPGGGATVAVTVVVAPCSAVASWFAASEAEFSVLLNTDVSELESAAAPGQPLVTPDCAPATGTAVQNVATPEDHADANPEAEADSGSWMAESNVLSSALLWPGVSCIVEVPNCPADA